MMNEFPMHIEWKRNGPFAVVETMTGWEMLVATTHLDLLRHANFKSCARVDCGLPFPRLSDHKKIYCDPECAYVVAQRALGKRRRNTTARYRRDGGGSLMTSQRYSISKPNRTHITSVPTTSKVPWDCQALENTSRHADRW